MSYLLLMVGFGLLIAGANYFVEGASKIAALLRVSPMMVGLTIVAFGTGSPEATVSIIAATNGNAGVSLGNVIGSNVFNTTLVVGAVALIMAIQVTGATIKKEIPFMLLASVALLLVISDPALQQSDDSLITRGDGLILLLFFAIFMYYIFEAARNSREETGERQTGAVQAPWGKNILYTAAGLAAIVYGGHLVVKHSTTIALQWGMTETLVGLTIVAAGTSLPELVTSVAAALKKQNEIAVGNIVGSNIFNILFVLGVSSVISPLEAASGIGTDVVILIVLTGLLLIVSRTGYKIGRIEGVILTLAYAGYMAFILIRG
ncbi:calcium/sodium antiporter [Paenibacillus sp. 1P07SE]|uniref:calcium/sodium antiporter n=1 Tax=Paenibacillus sp. 1P07SE TaxID=3132209 RepID=UPI0039A64E0F